MRINSDGALSEFVLFNIILYKCVDKAKFKCYNNFVIGGVCLFYNMQFIRGDDNVIFLVFLNAYEGGEFMSKKSGFTLVEVLVVIAISSIMLVAISGLIIFLSDTSGDMIQRSEELTKAQSVSTYLRDMVKNEEIDTVDDLIDRIFHDRQNGLVHAIKDENLKDMNLTYLYFYIDESTDFICCRMDFEDRKQFDFILGVVTPSTQEDE